MVFQANAWKFRFVALCVLGLTILGCKGSGTPTQTTTTNLTVSGKVTYTRIPEVKNARGIPIGLETDPKKFLEAPARWIMVRLHTAKEETDANGKKNWVWQTPVVTFTDTSGNYSLAVPPETYGFVELVGASGRSVSADSTALATSIRLIAQDSQGKGIESALPADERPIYIWRKPFDGTTPSNPLVPAGTAKVNATVDFSVGVNEKWMISTWSSTTPESASWETNPTGSRALAILDSSYLVASTFEDAGPGTLFLLHYAPGISHPRGSFVEYDPLVFPLAFSASGSGNRYTFGSIRGGSENDDAWDEGVLLPLFCRNRLWQQALTRLYPIQARRPEEAGFLSDVQRISPDLALLQGLPEAMAASLLTSPYLADHANGAVTVRDIRDWKNAGTGPFSAPALSSATWELILKANSLTSPGTPDEWAKLSPKALKRFFMIKLQMESDSTTPKDVSNFYTQLLRLQETKDASEPVDLAAIFTDAALNALLTPYGMSWPRPTTGSTSNFLTNWGKDPLSFQQSVTFSMDTAATDRLGQFPNASPEEVFYAKMLLSKDVVFAVSITPAPPTGAQLELNVGNREPIAFSSSQTGPIRLSLAGNSTTPLYVPYRLRVVSPTVQQASQTYLIKFNKLSSLVHE